jgi:hypothetical protein
MRGQEGLAWRLWCGCGFVRGRVRVMDHDSNRAPTPRRSGLARGGGRSPRVIATRLYTLHAIHHIHIQTYTLRETTPKVSHLDRSWRVHRH